MKPSLKLHTPPLIYLWSLYRTLDVWAGCAAHMCHIFLAAEEKKSLKRTFQQIQEEEDDDYPGSYSPQDPSAGPLLVCDSSTK